MKSLHIKKISTKYFSLPKKYNKKGAVHNGCYTGRDFSNIFIGLAFGLFMHDTVQLQWKTTCIGVVSWKTTRFIGSIYSTNKDAAKTNLAKAQFWFCNVGLLLLFLGMIMYPTGYLSFS